MFITPTPTQCLYVITFSFTLGLCVFILHLKERFRHVLISKHVLKARFPLSELTARVNGPS